MITSIRLVNHSTTSHDYFFLCMCMVITLKFYSLSKFQVYSIVLLSLVTLLYITSLKHTHLITGSLYLLTNIFLFLIIPSPWQSNFTVSASLAFLDSMYKCDRKRQWHPTPVLLPGKSHGWRSLVGCSPWGSQRVRHD